MPPRTGLLVHDHRLTVVFSRLGHVQHFTVELGQSGESGTPTLQARRLAYRRVRVGLERSVATLKVLELPPLLDADREAMLRFELERHLTFPLADAAFDAEDLPAADGASDRILVVATERRLVEQALKHLEPTRLRPTAVVIACHELPRLLIRRFTARRVAWVHRTTSGTDIVFLRDGQVLWSRNVPDADASALSKAITSSLPILNWKDCDAIWVSGYGAPIMRQSLAGTGPGAPVAEPPWNATARSLLAGQATEEIGTVLLALAVAMAPRRPALNLLPEALRPWKFPMQRAVTAGLVVLTAGLAAMSQMAQGHQDRRYLNELEVAARAVAPEVSGAEQVGTRLQQKKRLLAAIQSTSETGLRTLPVLRELTELLPQDVWLTSVNIDPKGVEINGQASAASSLIPVLEGSPWLEAVEFASPVTRAGDREQFQIRAGWERGPAGPRQ
jgi:Tfp pilus assembly protein PilN